MIVALADDLTGAAEIGGIAVRHGLSAEIQTKFTPTTAVDVIVVDTNTSACSPQEAADRVAAIAVQCRRAGATQIFKKVDSVLRGPVLAELTALLKTCGGSRALVVPANPSLGRTIQQGLYRVDDQPLHETDFAHDPDYPAVTSNVKRMLIQRSGANSAGQWPVQVLLPGETSPPRGIVIGESICGEDLKKWAEKLANRTIPAGAAEFFAAFLTSIGYKPNQEPPSGFAKSGSSLFVSGSPASSSRLFCQHCESSGTPVLRMPDGLFDRSVQPDRLLLAWATAAIQALKNHSQVVVAIDRPTHQNLDPPQTLTGHLSEVIAHVLAEYAVSHLFVEGGATAAALVQRLNWQQLRVKQELRPGVVCLQNQDRVRPLLTIKPGSYTWPLEVGGLH